MSLKKPNFLIFLYIRAFKISCSVEHEKKFYNLGARSHICEDSSVFVLLENAHSFGLFFFYRVLKQKRYSLKSFCV